MGVFNTNAVRFIDRSGALLPAEFYPPLGTVGQARIEDLEGSGDVVRVRYPIGTTCIRGFHYHCRGRLEVIA